MGEQTAVQQLATVLLSISSCRYSMETADLTDSTNLDEQSVIAILTAIENEVFGIKNQCERLRNTKV